jgi:uncharacterized protein (DUF1501 family)
MPVPLNAREAIMTMSYPSRRTLLKTLGLGTVAGGGLTAPRSWAAPLWSAALAGARGDARQRNLVVLQLSGGNDGLNTVIPYADDAYRRNRLTLGYRPEEVLRIDDYVGWHPSARGLANLLEAGELAVVQGVGYPNPNRSHFESMDLWHTAHGEGRSSGWLGRWADSRPQAATPQSVYIGRGAGPLALQARQTAPLTVAQLDQLRLRDERTRRLLAAMSQDQPEDGATVAAIASSLRVAVRADRELAGAVSVAGEAGYPATQLGRDLQTVATMIRSSLPAQVFYVTLDGFDTHANQRQAHAALLQQLADATQAFCDDLRGDGLLERTLIMAFSEFGRRVRENGSQGTDHGVAGPMFLAGGAVRGGLVGSHPDLRNLVDGDLAHGIDYRRVYSTILERWFETESEPLLSGSFAPLPELLSDV